MAADKALSAAYLRALTREGNENESDNTNKENWRTEP